jgi:hypothetical protein
MASTKYLPHPNFGNFDCQHSIHVYISADNNAVCYRYDEETDSRIFLRPVVKKFQLEELQLIFSDTIENDNTCRVISSIIEGTCCSKRRSLHYRPEWDEDCYFCHFEQEKATTLSST